MMKRPHTVTAKLVIPSSGSIDGVVIDQTDVKGGWMLYLRSGKPTYVYRFVGAKSYKFTAADPLSVGEHDVRLEFAHDEHGTGSGGEVVTLFVDGERAGSTRYSRRL